MRLTDTPDGHTRSPDSGAYSGDAVEVLRLHALEPLKYGQDW